MTATDSSLIEFYWIPIRREDAPNTYLTLELIEKVLDYQRRLRVMVLEHLDRNVFLIEPDLSRGIETIPYIELFNAIETNLNHLVATDFVPGMELTKTWQGGLSDDAFLDFRDVNRWFRTIRLLYRRIFDIGKRYPTTNFFYLGMNPDHQAAGIPQRTNEVFAFNTMPWRSWAHHLILKEGLLLQNLFLKGD